MAYTALLQSTARTAWATWYDASDRACTVTAAAWGWYTGAFFSPAAKTRYDAIGRWVGIAAVVAVALGMTARIYTQAWVDGVVADNLPELGGADCHLAPGIPDTAPSAEPATPVPTPVPTGAHPALEGLTLAQLRRRAIAHNRALPAGDHRRIPGAARLTKAQAMAALAG